MNLTQPPPEFTWYNLTDYQQHSVKEKWYIYNFVDEHNGSNHSAFRELSEELNLSFQRISDKYYSIIG